MYRAGIGNCDMSQRRLVASFAAGREIRRIRVVEEHAVGRVREEDDDVAVRELTAELDVVLPLLLEEVRGVVADRQPVVQLVPDIGLRPDAHGREGVRGTVAGDGRVAALAAAEELLAVRVVELQLVCQPVAERRVEAAVGAPRLDVEVRRGGRDDGAACVHVRLVAVVVVLPQADAMIRREAVITPPEPEVLRVVGVNGLVERGEAAIGRLGRRLRLPLVAGEELQSCRA